MKHVICIVAIVALVAIVGCTMSDVSQGNATYMPPSQPQKEKV